MREEWVIDESTVHGNREPMDGAVRHAGSSVSVCEKAGKDVRGVCDRLDLGRQHRQRGAPIPGKGMRQSLPTDPTYTMLLLSIATIVIGSIRLVLAATRMLTTVTPP